jgi:uncharacterized membrane protein HdeD (DUF308 family)
MEFGIVTVVAITVIVYIFGLVVKSTKLDNKWIPAVCGLLGIALGVVALVIGMPDFPATDYLTAAAVGGASGLAATGVDQIFKQLK